jgi:prevent-host-death family protein
MRIAPLATVKAQLSAYLEQCKEEGPIVITRNGKAVAVLLAPIDDDDLEGLLLARSPRFQALLDKSRASIQAGKGSPLSNSGTLSPNVMENRQVKKGPRGPGGLAGAQQPKAATNASAAELHCSHSSEVNDERRDGPLSDLRARSLNDQRATLAASVRHLLPVVHHGLPGLRDQLHGMGDSVPGSPRAIPGTPDPGEKRLRLKPSRSDTALAAQAQENGSAIA